MKYIFVLLLGLLMTCTCVLAAKDRGGGRGGGGRDRGSGRDRGVADRRSGAGRSVRSCAHEIARNAPAAPARSAGARTPPAPVARPTARAAPVAQSCNRTAPQWTRLTTAPVSTAAPKQANVQTHPAISRVASPVTNPGSQAAHGPMSLAAVSTAPSAVQCAAQSPPSVVQRAAQSPASAVVSQCGIAAVRAVATCAGASAACALSTPTPAGAVVCYSGTVLCRLEAASAIKECAAGSK